MAALRVNLVLFFNNNVITTYTSLAVEKRQNKRPLGPAIDCDFDLLDEFDLRNLACLNRHHIRLQGS